ncbi:Rid family detoxifying hydrolase [Candidatus Gracilibacteria bacterium]|nr:Rid family detoxifying hydrolase [Candidatus Gracilibacteria bacterium]
MRIITTDSAPKACGAYSQAVMSGNMLYTAGQIGLDPNTNTLVVGIENQAHQVIKNIEAILISEGLKLKNVIKTTVFLSNIEDWGVVNEVYAEYFSHKPARSTVAVTSLPAGALLEIEVIAEIR